MIAGSWGLSDVLPNVVGWLRSKSYRVNIRLAIDNLPVFFIGGWSRGKSNGAISSLENGVYAKR